MIIGPVICDAISLQHGVWIVETSGKLGIRILVDETEIVSAAAAHDVDDKGIRDAAARLNFNTMGFSCANVVCALGNERLPRA